MRNVCCVVSCPVLHARAGTVYTDFHKDAHARSYILDAVDSSIDAVNEGIQALIHTKTTPAAHVHLRENKVRTAGHRQTHTHGDAAAQVLWVGSQEFAVERNSLIVCVCMCV